MLQYPDWNTPFEVHCDASDVGVGATLVQRVEGVERVVMYASRSLTKDERKYQAYEKEALALVWALELFKHYLKVSSFHVVTDCRSLLFIKNKAFNSRIGRWILRLQEFDFTIKHKAGSLLKDADTLSRAPLPDNSYGFADDIEPLYDTNPEAGAEYFRAAEKAILAANNPSPLLIRVVTRANAAKGDLRCEQKVQQLWESNPVTVKTRKRKVSETQVVESKDSLHKKQLPPAKFAKKAGGVDPKKNPLTTKTQTNRGGLRSNFGGNEKSSNAFSHEPEIEVRVDFSKEKEESNETLCVSEHNTTEKSMSKSEPQFFTCVKELEGYDFQTWITEQNNPNHKDMQFILKSIKTESSDGNITLPLNSEKSVFRKNQQGLLVKVLEGKERIVVPESLRAFVMRQHHNSPLHAHQGRNRFQRMLGERYFWPGMKRDTSRWVRACVSCARRKTPRPLGQGLTTPALARHPFEVVGIDLVGKCPETEDGQQWILTIVDHFTRWPIAVPIPDRQASTIAYALYKNLVCEHGVPVKILSDQGRELIGRALQLVYNTWGIRGVHTGGYNPQANGACERFHRWLNTTLTQLYDKKTPNWDRFIPAVLFAYRVSVNDVTGYSPYFLLHGRDPVLPSDITFIPGERPIPTYDEHRTNVTELLRRAFDETRQRQYKAYVYNYERSRPRTKPDLSAGDLVLVWKKTASETRMEVAGVKTSLPSKWHYPWIGPGRFVREINNTTCEVELYNTRKSYNYNRVVKFHPWDEEIVSTTVEDDGAGLFKRDVTLDSSGEPLSLDIDEPFLIKLTSDTHSGMTHAVGMYRGMKGEYIDFQWMGNYGNGKLARVFLPGWVDPRDNKEYYKNKPTHHSHKRFMGESTETYVTLKEILLRGSNLLKESGKLTASALAIISSSH